MNLHSLIRLRPRSDSLFVSRGRTVLVTGLNGFIRPNSKEGLFVHETRLLSRYRYLLNDEEFSPVALSNIEQHSWLGYYIQLPPEMQHGRSPGVGQTAQQSQHSVELMVHRLLGQGLHEDLSVTNFNQVRTSFELLIELEADFADQEEVPDRRKQHGDLRRTWRRADSGCWELNFEYEARHYYSHQGNSGDAYLHRGLIVRILQSDSEPHCGTSVVSFHIALEPHSTWRACIDFIPLLESIDAATQNYLCALHDNPGEFEKKRQDFIAMSSAVETPGHLTLAPVATAALERARDDLAALRFQDLDSPGGWTFAAGIPLYTALFGRDTLIAAWHAAMLSTQLLGGTLTELAKWQADSVNLWRDQLPNAMLHEAHTGPLSVLNYTPRAKYYGTLTTPIFYSIALAELWRWAGHSAITKPLMEAALRGFQWLEQYARSSRHGFYQYQTSSEQGVKNQAWKDSGDAIVYDDGSQVPTPIAICEAQGYLYAARMQLAQVLWEAGRQDEARLLHDVGVEFKKRFNQAFWMEDADMFALGLDAKGQQIRSIASNGLHTLGTGIAGPEQAARTADRLFCEDMFSGWGIRTLSAEHPAYDPYSYHRGSVWPVEQGSFALGLSRYGRHAQLLQLCQAQFELAGLFECFRLPEVFSGHQRDRLHPFPALYPEANSPQAWSASAVFAMLASILGLFPYAAHEILFVDPHLPAWLPEVTVRNLHVGGSTVTLRFFREANGRSEYQVLDMIGNLRVSRRPDAWALLDLLGDELRQQLAVSRIGPN